MVRTSSMTRKLGGSSLINLYWEKVYINASLLNYLHAFIYIQLLHGIITGGYINYFPYFFSGLNLFIYFFKK